MDVEARLNEVADHLAHEGLTYRASRVREGAVEIARQRHRIEWLKAALSEYADEANWRLNGKFDPNSPWFQGRAVAKAALAGVFANRPALMSSERQMDEKWFVLFDNEAGPGWDYCVVIAGRENIMGLPEELARRIVQDHNAMLGDEQSAQVKEG